MASHNTVRRVASLLRSFFAQQARELLLRTSPQSIRDGKLVDLSHWADRMKAVIFPALMEEARSGMTLAARELQETGAKIDMQGLTLRLSAKINDIAEKLISETNSSYTNRVNQGITKIRELLSSGKVGPINAKRMLADFIREEIADPKRALRIANTELFRAEEAGKMLTAELSGKVRKHMWVLRPGNNCKKCIKLDGKVVRIGKPFVIDPSQGDYGII